ncbi:MAG: hypothetical protein ABI618_18390, partial [Nitrospirota bacterium]
GIDMSYWANKQVLVTDRAGFSGYTGGDDEDEDGSPLTDCRYDRRGGGLWWEHYWARELTKLGHEVRLIAPQFVTLLVQMNKSAWPMPSGNGWRRKFGKPGIVPRL